MNRNRQLKALYRIADLVNTTLNMSTLLRRIVRETADTFKASSAMIAFADVADGGTLTVEVDHNVDGDDSQVGLLLPPEHVAARAFERKETLRSVATKTGNAEMAALLKNDSTVMGILYVQAEKGKPFSEDDERLMTAVAGQAARIIHTLRMYERLSRQTTRLESLFELGQMLISTDPLPEILNRVTESILTILDIKQCTVLLVGKGHDLQLSASSGGAGTYTQWREVTESLVEKFSARGEPIRVLDVKKPKGRRPGKLPRTERSTTLLAVPIFYQERLVGILNVYTAEPRHFEPDEMRLFKAYATLCGVAIENARRHERLLAAAEEIRVAGRANTLQAIAGELSRRVRNPLGSSNLLLDALRDEGAFPAAHGEDYEVLISNLRAVDETIGRLHDLARRRTPNLEWLDMNQLVENVLALCQHRIAARQIMINKRLTSDLPRILADWGEMQQVVLQAVTNAMEAMRHGGILNVATTLIAGPDDSGGIPMVRINVRDTGPGLPSEIADDVLDPFGRAAGSFAGLGLFVASTVAQKYGGRLTVRNATDHGTSVSLTMPALENQG